MPLWQLRFFVDRRTSGNDDFRLFSALCAEDCGEAMRMEQPAGPIGYRQVSETPALPLAEVSSESGAGV